MAHETENGISKERKNSIVSFQSSFWLIVILVGLFIASLNFVKIMGSEHEKGEAGKEQTEATHEGTEMKNEEKGNVKEEPKPAATTPPEPEHK